MRFVDWLLLAAAGFVAIPFLVLAVESLAALLPARRPRLSPSRPRCAVVVPAHDEEAGLAATVRNVREQLVPGDRIVVVADNCTDGTASVARAAGAEVVERVDPDRRGKGFALDRRLGPSPIGSTRRRGRRRRRIAHSGRARWTRSVRQVAATDRPAQGVYLIGDECETDPRRRLSAFAVVLKNQIRPLGLDRLGMPCLLTGTGMAFPWRSLRAAAIGTGNIVEDMKLGVDLALAGHAPRLCLVATAHGAAAPDRRAHDQAAHALGTRACTHAADASAPFDVGGHGSRPARIDRAWLGTCRSAGVAVDCDLGNVAGGLRLWWQWADGSIAPFLVLFGSAALSGFAVFAAWFRFGRRALPFADLLAAPVYIAWKIPIYVKMLMVREKVVSNRPGQAAGRRIGMRVALAFGLCDA